MSGALFSYSDVTFRLEFTGEGRGDKYIFRPVSQQSFVAWAPPGALNQNAPVFRQHVFFGGPGNRTILSGATVAALSPWVPTYVAVVPPSNSAVTKFLKGANGDTGVKLINGLPLILALPNPVPPSWALVYNMGASEDLDIYLF